MVPLKIKLIFYIAFTGNSSVLSQNCNRQRILEDNPPDRRITHLATGSWVDHSLARWIGTENKNILWNFLLEARKVVQNMKKMNS